MAHSGLSPMDEEKIFYAEGRLQDTPYSHVLSENPVLRLAENGRGRDFVCGDIHGRISRLEAQLDQLGFDPDRDRLFSVGDLIDRGPENERALEFLRHSKAYWQVLGNHDQMLIDSVLHPHPEAREYHRAVWMFNGGEWALNGSIAAKSPFKPVVPELAARLRQMPYAIQIGERVGIVHAEPAAERRWPEFLAELEEGRDNAVAWALWARSRWQRHQRGLAGQFATPGIEVILCGHTPVSRLMRLGNQVWLDTEPELQVFEIEQLLAH